VSAVGGILVALGGSLPISPYVTTISFAIYVICRLTGARRMRRGWGPRGIPQAAGAISVSAGDSRHDSTLPVPEGVSARPE
jgi:zinc/manganese transport system permease protein